MPSYFTDEVLDNCEEKINSLVAGLVKQIDPGKPDPVKYYQRLQLLHLANELENIKNRFAKVKPLLAGMQVLRGAKHQANDAHSEFEVMYLNDIHAALTQAYVEALIADSRVVNGKPATIEKGLAPQIESIIKGAGPKAADMPNPFLPDNYNSEKSFENQFLGAIAPTSPAIHETLHIAVTDYYAGLVATRENIRDLNTARCAKALHIASQFSPPCIDEWNRKAKVQVWLPEFNINQTKKAKATVSNFFSTIAKMIKKKAWGLVQGFVGIIASKRQSFIDEARGKADMTKQKTVPTGHERTTGRKI
jgi:hypothetical protein